MESEQRELDLKKYGYWECEHGHKHPGLLRCHKENRWLYKLDVKVLLPLRLTWHYLRIALKELSKIPYYILFVKGEPVDTYYENKLINNSEALTTPLGSGDLEG